MDDSSNAYDVVIIGGGPSGLQAALMLARARRRVLLCDAGERRNQRAVHVHGFLSRDGTPPDVLRAAARADLARYATVSVRDVRVEAVTGTAGAFEVRTGEGTVRARRILLAVGMIDTMLPIPGFAEAWGHGIFQCPYCHGYEVRDRAFAFLAPSAAMLEFALLLRNWTHDVRVLTHGAFDVPPDVRERFARHGVALETRPIDAIEHEGGVVRAVVAGGERIACDVVFARPPQRQTALVTGLDVGLDDAGYVRVDEMLRTSRAGIYAAGDIVTPQQAVAMSVSWGARAAAALNHDLSLDDAP